MVVVHRAGVRAARVETFAAALAVADRAAVIGVDMPIGLLDAAAPGGRECDGAARALLGARRSSVFSPPVRQALAAASYAEALALNRASSPARLGISLECFNLFPKLREVDDVLRARPALQRRVKEVHPELAFLAMANGGRPPASKRTAEGRDARVRLLSRAGFPDVAAAVSARGPGVAVDDVLDAHAVCWSAMRIATGLARRLPDMPPRDGSGLLMEIWH